MQNKFKHNIFKGSSTLPFMFNATADFYALDEVHTESGLPGSLSFIAIVFFVIAR